MKDQSQRIILVGKKPHDGYMKALNKINLVLVGLLLILLCSCATDEFVYTESVPTTYVYYTHVREYPRYHYYHNYHVYHHRYHKPHRLPPRQRDPRRNTNNKP